MEVVRIKGKQFVFALKEENESMKIIILCTL